jgi:phosphoenolpyruvate-protein phosphotransferase (PTS system enzyme I)
MKTNITTWKAIPASPGKFYGQVQKIISSNHLILESHITAKQVRRELFKFSKGLAKTKKEMESIIQKTGQDVSRDILQAQIAMVDDPMLISRVKNRIEVHLESAPLALFHVIDQISKEFMAIEDEYFRERAEDIRDIGRRIENNVLGKKSDSQILTTLKRPVILVATELTASQMLNMEKKFVKGIITERGGKTGHMAILARYFQIPAVVGLSEATERIGDEEHLLIDGDNGFVIRNPHINQIKFYGYSETLRAESAQPLSEAYTKDGERIQIKVNLESEADAEEIVKKGVDGVGLYRSEILLMAQNSTPSEEEQFLVYQRIALSLDSKPFVLRTFDVGADKYHPEEKEENPFLGERGIRYCLRKKDWFKKQLRAILRATPFGNIWILLPMVTQVSEVLETRELILECKRELTQKGQKFKKPKLGVMVETPACALNLSLFAEHCDFFSVGTNDLLQYFVAVDRNNHKLSYLYNPLNYSFLHSLRLAIQTVRSKEKPISICGEIASDTNYTILLIGLGIREFSVSLPFVRRLHKIIKGIDLSQAESLAIEVLRLTSQERYQEAEAYLFNQHIV